MAKRTTPTFRIDIEVSKIHDGRWGFAMEAERNGEPFQNFAQTYETEGEALDALGTLMGAILLGCIGGRLG